MTVRHSGGANPFHCLKEGDDVLTSSQKCPTNLISITDGQLYLSPTLFELGVLPAIDVTKSGTRKEELLVEPDVLRKMYVLRRILNPMGTVDAIEFLLDKLRQTKTNSDFFDSMNT